MEEFLYLLGTIAIFAIVGYCVLYIDDDKAEM